MEFQVGTGLAFGYFEDFISECFNLLSGIKKSLFFVFQFLSQILDFDLMLNSQVFQLFDNIGLKFNFGLMLGDGVLLLLDFFGSLLIGGSRDVQKVVELRFEVVSFVFLELKGFLEFFFHDFSFC